MVLNRHLGGWFLESQDCIVCLSLQSSNYSSKYYLNIKIYIQHAFGNKYKKDKILLNDTGDFFRSHPMEYEEIFDCEIPMDPAVRKEKLRNFFTEFLVPFCKQALTREGIKSLYEKEIIILFPVMKEQLKILWGYDAGPET